MPQVIDYTDRAASAEEFYTVLYSVKVFGLFLFKDVKGQKSLVQQ